MARVKGILFFTTALVILGGCTADDPLRQDIVKNLDTAEKALLTLRVDGEAFYAYWDSGKKKWIRTPEYFHFNTIFENRLRGCYTLETSPRISRWVNGTAPFIATWEQELCNGKEKTTTELYYRLHDGKQFVSQKIISNHFSVTKVDRSNPFYLNPVLSGLTFYACGVNKKSLLSDLKDKRSTDQFAHLDIEEISLEQQPWIKITFFHKVSPERVHIYLLNPRQNYALYEYRNIYYEKASDKEPRILEIHRVRENKEIAPGVFYPVRADVTTIYNEEYFKLLKNAKMAQGDPDPVFKKSRTSILFSSIQNLGPVDKRLFSAPPKQTP